MMRQSQNVNNTSSLASCSSENIKVVVRLRPKLEREYDQRANPFKVLSNSTIQASTKGDLKTYTFDYIATEDSTQSEIFDETAKSICDSVLEGYNGTIFVYGQTSSGKTYTILGSSYSSLPKELNNDSTYSVLSFGSLTAHSNHNQVALTNKDDNRGILPRILEYLFMQASCKYQHATIAFSCSFLEIYQEQLSDLLDPNPNKQLSIQTTNGSVAVDNLSKLSIKSVEEGYSLIIKGNKLRHIAPTGMNKESSRSHAVFSIYVESKMNQSLCDDTNEGNDARNKAKPVIRKSVFHVIDLAGSERQKGTEATGERLKEAGMINKSLMQLSFVIKSLSDASANRNNHIHYRDSKLTMLLKDSIGGNSKTCIIANISPSYQNINESISTLSFAKRAKRIKNKAIINEVKVTESITQFHINHMLEKYNAIKAENFYLLSLLKKNCTVNANQSQSQAQIVLKKHRPSENQRDFAITLDSIEEEIEEMLKEIAMKEQDITALINQRAVLKDQLQKLELDYTIKEKEIEDTEDKTKAIKAAYIERKNQISEYNHANGALLERIAKEQRNNNEKTINNNEEIRTMKRAIDNNKHAILAIDNEMAHVINKQNEVKEDINITQAEVQDIKEKQAQATGDLIATDAMIQDQMISIAKFNENINQMRIVINDKDNDIQSLSIQISQLKQKSEDMINKYKSKIDALKSIIAAKETEYKIEKDEKANLLQSLSQLKQDNASLELTYLNTVEMRKTIGTEVNDLKKKRQSVLNGITRYETENDTVMKEINLLTEDQGSTTSKISLLNKSKQENTQLKEGLNELKKAYDCLLKNVTTATGNKEAINAQALELVNYDTQLTMKKNIMKDMLEKIKAALPLELKLKLKLKSDKEKESEEGNVSIGNNLLFYFNVLYDYDESLDKSLRHLKEEYNQKEEKLTNLNKKMLLVDNNDNTINEDDDDNKENVLLNNRCVTEMKSKRRSEMNSNCIKSQSHLKIYNHLFGFKRKYDDFIPFASYEEKNNRSIDNSKTNDNDNGNDNDTNDDNKRNNDTLPLTNTKKKPAPSAINTHQKAKIHIQRIALGCRSQIKFKQNLMESNTKNQSNYNRSSKKSTFKPSTPTLTQANKTKAYFPKTAHI